MFEVQVTRLQGKLNCVEALEHKVEEQQSFISALQRCMDAKPYNKAIQTKAKPAAIRPVTSKPTQPVAASLIKSPAPKLTAKPAAKPEKEKEVFLGCGG